MGAYASDKSMQELKRYRWRIATSPSILALVRDPRSPESHVARCFWVCQGVSECFRVCQGVSGCFRVCQGVSGCVRVFQGVSEWRNYFHYGSVFHYGSGRKSYTAINQPVSTKVRASCGLGRTSKSNDLQRRHKLPSRGIRHFSYRVIFDDYGVWKMTSR